MKYIQLKGYVLLPRPIHTRMDQGMGNARSDSIPSSRRLAILLTVRRAKRK
ncbi:hypothetical protein [Spirosoma sp. 209]|uniref:hypothetical protein n=1 Tax=Spirosoma sp. 209 TaxID=1955701 RepID=UPI0013748459|nr:hypothetical protein [Spirosoma sp. 209]